MLVPPTSYTPTLNPIFRSSDCNYEHLEQLLDEEWRRYINKIVMTPISVTKQDYNSFCRGLDHDEKVFYSDQTLPKIINR